MRAAESGWVQNTWGKRLLWLHTPENLAKLDEANPGCSDNLDEIERIVFGR